METAQIRPFDWSSHPGVRLEMGEHPRLQTLLTLRLSADLWGALHTELERVLRVQEAELRLELPGKWTLYWKARSGSSRVLLAHPETDQWVGTVAWSEDRVSSLIEALNPETAAQQPGGVFLSECDGLTFPSNLEICLRLSG